MLTEPWPSYTSLLVFPGGADLPFCREFNGKGNQLISQYVNRGGRFIGFCAGGYYASGEVEFEVGNDRMEVNGERELKFFPGIARGCVFKGFEYGSVTCGRAANVQVEMANLDIEEENFEGSFRSYVNGGCLFVDADDYTAHGVEVLGRYIDDLDVKGSDKEIDSGKSPAAAVYCKVGNGCAVATGIHPEFSPELLARLPDNMQYTKMINMLIEDNRHRFTFLRAILKKMNLKVNNRPDPIPGLSRLSLTSSYPPRLTYLIEDLQKDLGGVQKHIIKGEKDTFRLWDSRKQIFEDNQNMDDTNDYDGENIDHDGIIKEVDVFYTGLPENRMTSSFNHELYYNSLKGFQGRHGSREEIGTILLYGEVVTSTSTLLYKNYSMLRHLPTGFSVVGSVQIAGRGRGNNVWVNPPGVLAVSTVLRMPLRTDNDKPSPMVFTQYIVALAMVEAIKFYGYGYDSIPVRLKWPNDIYCKNPEFDDSDDSAPARHVPEFLKIGGLLMNTHVFDNEFVSVAGLGLNVNNNEPSTSLNAILSKLDEQECQRRKPFKIEILLAKFFVKLEQMLVEFKYQGFKPFERDYYQHWLHTGSIVTLEQYGNVKAIIKGISMDSGMLMAQEIDRFGNPVGKIYELQPDGNSFDMMKGLIKKKT